MNFISRTAYPAACLRPRATLFASVRFTETINQEKNEVAVTEADDEEIKAMRELQIEKKRNKSRLYPDHYAAYHGINPYPKPAYEYHESLRHKRRSFGKYGEASGVDPSVLWPTPNELSDFKDLEAVTHPFTIQEMVENWKQKRDKELKESMAREADILAKVVKIEQWKKEFHEKVRIKTEAAAVAKEKKDRLVEEIRRHFGFKIDPRDDRFKEMLEKKEKEEKKLRKAERQKVRDKQLIAQAEEVAAKEDLDNKANKVEKPEDDSDDEDVRKK